MKVNSYQVAFNFVSNRNKDAGFILVTVLLMVVALSLIGITAMIVSSNEVLIAGHINKGKEVFYIAEAALEEVKYNILNDPLKGKTTATAVGSLTDTSQNWSTVDLTGMQVIDAGANEFNVTVNTTTILSISGTTAPLGGNYYIVFKYYDRGSNGVNGVGTLDTFTVLTADWSSTNWNSCLLIDSSSTGFNISGNTINTLSVTGTPANGDWTIDCNRGSSGQMSIVDDPGNGITYSLPGYITASQDGWILIDSAGNSFSITDGGSGFLGNIIAVDSGTPANGDIIVARPAWMYDSASPIMGNGTLSTWTKTYTIGTTTANATVTISMDGQKGSYIITSVGSLAKARKAIEIDLTDTGNGDTYFKDWHETTPP